MERQNNVVRTVKVVCMCGQAVLEYHLGALNRARHRREIGRHLCIFPI